MYVLRRVFLCVLQEEVAEIALARTRHPEDERVGYLAVMQVQEVWCAVVCLQHGQILGPRCALRFSPGRIVNRKLRSA